MALSKIKSSSMADTAIHGRRNLLINGDYKIWQRAISSTAANYSGPDRWYYGNAGTYSRSTDVPSGEGFQYSNTVKVTAATSYGVTAQRIEAVNCKHLVGKTVTASFWLKTISGSTSMNCVLYRANTEDGHSSGVTVIETKPFTGVTNTWTYYTLTWSNLPSETTNGLQLYFFSADASTDPEYRITGIQLEVGEQATPFEHRSFGEELALCQRYYEKSFPYATAPASNLGDARFTIGTEGQVHFKVRKRANATMTSYGALGTGSNWHYFSGTWVSASPGMSGNEVLSSYYLGTTSFVAVSGQWAADAEL